jgi:signal peptidase I
MPVTPKMSGRGLPLPPRVLIVSMIVALVAFAVGLQINPTRVATPTAPPTDCATGQQYLVQQMSMENTLQPGDDVSVVPAAAYNRGDIVVFAPPTGFEAGSTTPFIKRVIGIANDTVSIHDGRVTVNGVALVEPYVAEGQSTDPAAAQSIWVVPPGELFVLGDHRAQSQDSRVFGPIPVASVDGAVTFRCSPSPGPVSGRVEGLAARAGVHRVQLRWLTCSGLRPDGEPERPANRRGAEGVSGAACLQFVGSHHIDVAPGLERPEVAQITPLRTVWSFVSATDWGLITPLAIPPGHDVIAGPMTLVAPQATLAQIAPSGAGTVIASRDAHRPDHPPALAHIGDPLVQPAKECRQLDPQSRSVRLPC